MQEFGALVLPGWQADRPLAGAPQMGPGRDYVGPWC